MPFKLNPHFFDSMHLDAAESIFYAGQLETVSAGVYEERFAEYDWRTLIPTRLLAPGEDDIKYRRYTGVGVAQFIVAYADDLPRVDLAGAETIVSAKDIGDSYGVSLKEVRRAAMVGTNVSAAKAIMARRAMEQKLQQVAETGSPERGLYGLINQPNVTIAAAGGTWATRTPAQIVADVNALVQGMRDDTKRIESPTDLLLPDAQYTLLATTPYQAGLETTILDFILKTNRYLRNITAWDSLKGAGAGGTNRIVAYRKAPDVLEGLVREFEELGPQVRNLETVTNCIAATGGVIVSLPMAVRYMDGV